MAFNDIHIDEPTDEELCEVFIEEAESIVVELGELADRCRKDLANPILLKDIRRQFHTLKGSGRMVGLDAIGEAAWRVEDMLNRWLSSELPATLRLCDFVESCAPFFGAWAAELKEHGKVSVDAKSIAFEVEVFLDYLKNPAAASVSGQAAPADSAQEEMQGPEQSAPEYVPLTTGDMSDFDALMGLSEDATPPAVNNEINLAAAVEHAGKVSAESGEIYESLDGEIESYAQAPDDEENDNFAMGSAGEDAAFALEDQETHGQHFAQRQDEYNAIPSPVSERLEGVGEASETSCIAPMCSDESFEDGESDGKYSESHPDIQEKAGKADSEAKSALETNEAQDEPGAPDKDDIEKPVDTDSSIAGSEKAFEDERDELAKFMSETVAAEAEPSFSAGHAACDEEEQNSAAQPVYDKSSAETLENSDDRITDEILPSYSDAPTQGSARLEGFAELLEDGGSGVERVQAQWEEEADTTKAKSSKPMKENRDYAPLIYSGMIAAILAAGIYGFFFM